MSASMKNRTAGRQNDRKSGRHKVDRKTHPIDISSAFSGSIIPWSPSTYTAFQAILSARLCAAIWSHITDCDETFNYWEPLHYLLHGRGFQTWEYSPVYAIRSYAFVWLYGLPLKLYTAVTQSSAVLEFYFLRTLLAFCCAFCEVFFYRAICKRFGPHPGRLVLCFLIFSSGLFISATAFLPSTFSMYMSYLALGAWFVGFYPLAIFSVAASAILSWPFAGALGIPIAYDVIFRQRRLSLFIKWSIVSAIICAVPQVLIDSYYYGKLVIAPLNIVIYNVFSDHGPEIYGVEPWSFYFINGFLNFNAVFILALVAVPFVMFANLFIKTSCRDFPIWLSLGPMCIWILIFFTRAHKEERFLFPIYPLFCLAGALTLDTAQRFYHWLVPDIPQHHHGNYVYRTSWAAILFCVFFATASMSRSLSLYKGYRAPLDVYGELNKLATDSDIHSLPADRPINLCVGKEWYRFPSNFFMPSERWKLQFLRSQFRGQLPKHYSAGADATRIIPSHMNDMNLEETSRYVEMSKCHYLVDLDLPTEAEYEPRFSENNQEWKVVASGKFLDNQRSHKLLRAFYFPILSEKHNSYINYNILQSTSYKTIKL